MTLRFALACGFVGVAALAAAAQSWRPYGADVPADWRAEPPPSNGDGAAFVSPDGGAKITVFGHFPVEASLSQALDELATPREGERVVYMKRGVRSLTLSGLNGDTIFYRSAILTCADKVWNNLEIIYPASQKRAYDALVAHVAGSLRGGRPEGMQCPSP
ncbi:MAG: hypothetical protein ABSE69_15475 [Roseiarcus sp.]|jgi:hypothetical protein